MGVPSPTPGLLSYPPSYSDSQSCFCLRASSRPQRTRTRSSCELCFQQSTLVQSVVFCENTLVIDWVRFDYACLVAWGGAGRPPSEDSAESLYSGLIRLFQNDCLPLETMDCEISGWLSHRGLLLGCRIHLSCPAAQGAGILLDSV